MTSSSGRKRIGLAIAAAVVLIGAGVVVGALAFAPDDHDDRDGLTISQLRDIQASINALPQCSEVFRVGQVIGDAETLKRGCLDPGGDVVFSGHSRCVDGRYLWQVDATTGAAAGFGFSGGKYIASKEAASDPAYAKANAECQS